MPSLPKRHVLAGWCFLAIGLCFLEWPGALPRIERWLHSSDLAVVVVFERFGVLASVPLFFITAWGIGHQRRYSRWTGTLPCLYMLLAFSYITPIGLGALYYLWTQRSERRGRLSAAEFWNSRRQSGWMLTASVLGWLVARGGFTLLQQRALGDGLPVEHVANPGLLIFLLLLWLHVTWHECGHAIAAKLVGHRLKALAAGPLVFSKETGRLQLRWEWASLLMVGGYVRAAPVTRDGYREKTMFVVLAGPAASLIAGAGLLGIAQLMPGTSFEPFWPAATLGAMLGYYLAVANLLPFGYSDGTIFFHLLFRTRRSQELIDLVFGGETPANAPQRLRNYEDDVRVYTESIRQLLDGPTPDPAQLGDTYIALGLAEMGAQRPRDAEAHLQQGLAVLPEGSSYGYEAAGWEGLGILRCARYDAAGVQQAYEHAIDTFRILRCNDLNAKQRLQLDVEVCRLHVMAVNWQATLEEAESGLAECPDEESRGLERGLLLSLRAQALLHTGRLDRGLEALKSSRGRTARAACRDNRDVSVRCSGLFTMGCRTHRRSGRLMSGMRHLTGEGRRDERGRGIPSRAGGNAARERAIRVGRLRAAEHQRCQHRTSPPIP